MGTPGKTEHGETPVCAVVDQLTTDDPGIWRGEHHMPTASVLQILEATEATPTDRVVAVGTQNPFLLAALGRMAREVFAVEASRPAADRVRTELERIGATNVSVRTSSKLNLPDQLAPFDVILTTATSRSSLAAPLLSDAGRWVGLELSGGGYELIRIRRGSGRRFIREELGSVNLKATLGEIIVSLRLMTTDALAPILEQFPSESALRSHLVENNLLSDRDLCLAVACRHGIESATVEQLLQGADPEVIRALPRRFLKHQGMLPLRVERGAVIVAVKEETLDLSDLEAAYEPYPLRPFLVTRTDFQRLWIAIDLVLDRERTDASPANAPSGKGSATESTLEVLIQSEEELPANLNVDEQQALLLLQNLLLEAVGSDASDIHLESERGAGTIRLRVDGSLRTLRSMSSADMLRLVNIFKVRAGMNISERRLPQGGSLRVRVGRSTYDLRVQAQPTLWGENLVVRVLRQDVRIQTIDELGFAQDIAAHYRRLLDSPSGMILVVGPTGSGKSTTLYSGIRILADNDAKKIVTIEDPIEYSIPGVQQSQTHSAIGFGFAEAVRSLLRQDPDAILIGEIRDAETARQAIRASQTGHLVLSTLHCNETTDAVPRLVDLGGDAASLSGELLAVLSQRLARRICRSCRHPAAPRPELLAELFPDGADPELACFEGAGCPRCGGHGTAGRIAALELLRVDDRLRTLIARGASTEELRQHAIQQGLRPLRDRALDLVQDGVVPLDDLPRFLSLDRLAPEIA